MTHCQYFLLKIVISACDENNRVIVTLQKLDTVAEFDSGLVYRSVIRGVRVNEVTMTISDVFARDKSQSVYSGILS